MRPPATGRLQQGKRAMMGKTDALISCESQMSKGRRREIRSGQSSAEDHWLLVWGHGVMMLSLGYTV